MAVHLGVRSLFLPICPHCYPSILGVLAGLTGLERCDPRPWATVSLPEVGFVDFLVYSPFLERGGLEAHSRAWFLPPQRSLIQAQSDPGSVMRPCLGPRPSFQFGLPRLDSPLQNWRMSLSAVPAPLLPKSRALDLAGSKERLGKGSRGGFVFLPPAKSGKKAAAAPRGRGKRHTDGINIIDGEAFWPEPGDQVPSPSPPRRWVGRSGW